jgi:hypothetical protein
MSHFSRMAFQGRAEGYRSGLEDVVAKQIASYGIPVQYELFPLRYTVPARLAKYTADFVLPNGIIIETKGRFVTADRTKHRLIREQYPDLDLRFVFSNPNNKIGKKSSTTYGMWCERLGIQYAARVIPTEWFLEPAHPKAVQAAKEILGWVKPTH